MRGQAVRRSLLDNMTGKATAVRHTKCNAIDELLFVAARANKLLVIRSPEHSSSISEQCSLWILTNAKQQ